MQPAAMAMRFSLVPHPVSPGLGVESVTLELAREQDLLALRYCVRGQLSGIAWPEPAEARRCDGLWQHTCFEWFVQMPAGYREFNFSPSSAWALYDFSSYRQPSEPVRVASGPGLRCDFRPLQLVCEVRLPLVLAGGMTGRFGASAVIEGVGGEKAYWALAHAGAVPDFHAEASFVGHWNP